MTEDEIESKSVIVSGGVLRETTAAGLPYPTFTRYICREPDNFKYNDGVLSNYLTRKINYILSDETTGILSYYKPGVTFYR